MRIPPIINYINSKNDLRKPENPGYNKNFGLKLNFNKYLKNIMSTKKFISDKMEDSKDLVNDDTIGILGEELKEALFNKKDNNGSKNYF